MIAIVLAAAAAVGWGASDYLGGDASRRETPVFVIVAVVELLGAALVLPILIARGVGPPASPRLLLSAVAGVAVTVELGLIFRALARGHAFITAPIGALGTALAVAVGLLGGDPIDLSVALGLVCALLGSAVSASSSAPSRVPDAGSLPRTIATCLAAAAAVGTMLTTLHAAGRLDPYWATTTEHVSTALSAGFLALIGIRRPRRAALPRPSHIPGLGLVAAAGVGGDLAYTSASHHGALSVVSAISSMYPLTTIVLGRVLQRRRARPVQVVGIVLALLGAAVLGAAAP